MVDAFNNYVNVAYTYDGTTDRTTAWTLTDIHGRVHTVSFVNSAYMAETIDRGQIVSSITTCAGWRHPELRGRRRSRG